DGNVVRMFKDPMKNPRNIALMESVDDTQGAMIFWAPHLDKIDQIIECLRTGYDARLIARYDGKTPKKERMQIIDDFQEGKYRFLAANPASAGTGLTLTA